MKIINRYFVVLILISITLVASSCSNTQKSKQYIEENKNEVQEEVIKRNKYDTIESTLVSLDEIGSRLIGTEGNYKFSDELKTYLRENFSEEELFIQPYTMNLTNEYKVSISDGEETVSFDEEESLCKYINKAKLTESVIVTDVLNGLDNSCNYIFITEDEKLIEKSKEYKNICLSLLAVDEVYLYQNVIKVRTDIPTIMNINKTTAEELLSIKNKVVKLNIEIKNKEVELENIFVVIKGNESKNAIVVTSHIDSTTAKGINYSKGAIDNGTGISLNLDLLRNAYSNKNLSDYDLIFAFVNSEEGFLLKSSSGSMRLNNFLAQRYENILNINLDCLGEKDIDVLSYGYGGNINGDIISDIIISRGKSSFTLERAEYYTSDNLNFSNSIYFYNFDYHGENRAIHTGNDNVNAVDIHNLKALSTIIFSVLSELMDIDSAELFI